MIALVTTYFLVFYILIPGVVFRFLTSWFVPLKLFERTRTQEAAFAVSVALLPFAATLFAVWHIPVVRHEPFHVAEGSTTELRRDYRRVASLLTASDASRLLSLNAASPSSPSSGPQATNQASNQTISQASNDANWHSLNQVLRRQARFLTWYFVLISIEGACFGLLAKRYGDWQSSPRRYRFGLWIIRAFILPNISEWHLLLTDFNWPSRDDIIVSVDVLQSDGLLYQGRVADYFIDSEGKLTGILLENVSRFDREAFHRATEAPNQVSSDVSSDVPSEDSKLEQPISSAAFWKPIPGSRFYIAQSSISNLNVRFVTRDQTLISLAEKILDAGNARAYDVAIISEDDATEPGALHPDIYS